MISCISFDLKDIVRMAADNKPLPCNPNHLRLLCIQLLEIPPHMFELSFSNVDILAAIAW